MVLRTPICALGVALVLACGSPQPTQQVGTPLDLVTYPRSRRCLQAALLPVSIGRENDAMVFFSAAAPDHQVPVAWPAGFTARLADGVAELVDPNGTVIGRERDVLDNLGGGRDNSGRFNVCSIGSVIY